VDLKRKTRKFESVLNGTPQLFKERAHTVKSILTDIRSGNTKKLHLNRLNHGILCAGRIKQLDDAREIFEWISQSEHFNLSVQSFNNMIWAAGNVGQLDLAKQYFNDLVARGRDNAGQSKKSGRKLTPNAHTFGSILHACSRSKSYKQALMYLDEMINMGLTPNQVVCTSAIDTCTKVGRYIEAVEIMERMTREYGLEPDTTMMNAVVKGFCLQGEYKRAEDILMAAAKPDIFTYHTLMMAYAKAGNFKSCLWVFDRLMENPNVRPDSGIYSLAMLAYANAQNYASVVMIDELARGEGVKLPPVAYTFLIKSLGKLGRFDSVIHVLDEMMDHGIEPNVITYSTAVSALRPSPELVHDVLTRFDKSQLKPNVIFLTSAIYALSGGGKDSTPLHVEKAYTIWQHMEEHGPAPNIQTYNNIAKSFAEAGEVEKAMSVLEVMHGRGVRPDKFTFTLLLHACAVRSSTDRIPEIMRSMLLAGIPHDEISFGAAMNAYRRAGDALGAVACLNEMAKLNVTATVSHYNIVLRALKEGKYIDKMYRMVLALSRSGCQSGSFQVNFNTFQIALEKLISLERCHECMVLIKEMDRHNLQPDLQLCVDIVQVLERSRQYRAVFAMYQLMVRHNYQFYENAALNGVFKRLVSVAAKSVDADLRSTAEVVRDEFVLWGFEFTQKVSMIRHTRLCGYGH
jgi:pentatricopeptide repeat domain-containing protein 1